MNNLLLSSVVNTYAKTLKLKRTYRFNRQLQKSVMILLPGTFGSIGDEAMIVAIIEYWRDKGVEKIGLISYEAAPGWENFNCEIKDIEIQHYSFKDTGREWIKFLHLASQYDIFYCIGADAMDGFYSENGSLTRLKYVSFAAKTGLQTAILGFSCNEKPSPKVMEAFRNLPLVVKLYSRDPVSCDRLTHYLQRPIMLVADLAFLLRPAKTTKNLTDIFQWVQAQKDDGRIVIGINANLQVFSSATQQAVDLIIKTYTNTLIDIYSKHQHKFSFLLIPHDFRNAENKFGDIGLSKEIFQALPKEIQSYCARVPTPFTAAEIKSLCAHLGIVLTARMHFCIACLGQGTPAACITYQGKFEGLFRHFELDDMLIQPEKAFQDKNLSQFFIPLIEKQEDIRQHIKLMYPKIQQLALINFR